MDTRPKKRQKRLTILSSDDEESDDPNPSTNHTSTKPRDVRKVPTSSKTSKSLPVRTRVKSSENGKSSSLKAPLSPQRLLVKKTGNGSPNAKQLKAAGSKSISAFFNAAAASNQRKTRATPEPPKATPKSEDSEEEDAIEDDSILVDAKKVSSTARPGLGHSKSPQPRQAAVKKPPSFSQGFKLPPKHVIERNAGNSEITGEPDSRPWVEQFGPSTLEELAVNKKKVADVRIWLERVLSGKEAKRLLILKGPSGSGKSTTLDVLGKAMGVGLVEWRSPSGSEFGSESYTSMSAQLEEFLRQTGRFGGLEMATSGVRSTTNQSKIPEHPQSNRARAIVLEEFPTNLAYDSNGLRTFRSSIMEYLASSTPRAGLFASQTRNGNDPIIPLILIMTETRLSSSGSCDSFTAQRILGPEILGHRGVSTIEFNVIAPSFLTKALDLILRKDARVTGRRQKPGSDVLKKLSESGDIRNAISSLEFLCVHGHDPPSKTGQSIPPKPSKASIELVTQRETSLGLFHAVGKVVYNKRSPSIITQDVPPPSHLSHLAKPRPSEVSPDALISETGTDTSTFLAALHENFLPSCSGLTFTETLNNCLDALSDADLLDSPRGYRYASFGGYQGASTDNIKAGEMSFQLAVRGLLIALPDPVKRASLPSGIPGRKAGRSDAFKMFFPTSARLGRQMEEVEEAVERWVVRSNAVAELGTEEGVLRGNGEGTKAELLLERLPFVARIEKGRGKGRRDWELERVTQFRGLKLAGDDEDEDADIELGGQARGLLGSNGGMSFDAPVESERKLYLSDDDIEDV